MWNIDMLALKPETKSKYSQVQIQFKDQTKPH
jgi:hypothetical protein